MNRLQTYVLTLLTLIGFSACSGSDLLPEPAGESGPLITYNVGLKARAASIHSSTTSITDFYVKAVTADGQPYIDCDHITRQADNSYAEADGFSRYWPAAGTRLGFCAVRGIKPDGMQLNDNHTGVVIPDFTLSTDISEQVDLLIANTGYLSSPTNDASSAPVPLTFRHALCQIVLRARNIDPAIDVEINGIGLKHIQNTATMTADFSSAASEPIKWTLENVENPDYDSTKPTYKILLEDKVVLNGTVDAKTNPDLIYDIPTSTDDRYVMLAIPQPVYAFNPATRIHGASLMLHANIWNVADDSGIHAPGDKKVWGLNPDEPGHEGEWMIIPIPDTVWQPGRCYVYTITFGGEGSNSGYQAVETDIKDRVFDPISITADIKPWIQGGDIVQNIY